MQKTTDLAGLIFGRLTVVAHAGRKGKAHYWLCRCECGTTKEMAEKHLRSGNTRSCGCLIRDSVAERNRTHGQSYTSEYAIWHGIKLRCTNPKATGYANYGGRGICMCPQWFNSFETFIADMGPRPEGHGLDRIDNDGDYSPENCHWATPKQNGRNRRTNRLLTYNGETHPMAEWADITGLPVNAIGLRLKHGWSVADALTRPIRITKRTRA